MQSSWLQLSYKSAIITGAGSGIGCSIAKAFANQGCNVLLIDIHKENVQRVAEECNQIGNKLQESLHKTCSTADSSTCNMTNIQPLTWSNYIVADITSKNEVHDIIKQADSLANESSLAYSSSVVSNNYDTHDNNIINPPPFASILVNAAGITRDKLIHNITEDDYDSVLNTNLKGTFLTCQAFCQPNRLDKIIGEVSTTHDHNDYGNNCASIINIGSIVSETGNIGQSNYAASKGGVIGLTRALAKEMAFYSTNRKYMNNSKNKNNSIINNLSNSSNSSSGSSNIKQQQQRNSIRVNAILPGFIDTPMSASVPDRVKERIKKQIPLGDFGHVDDIANMALFLSSSRSSYVTGSIFECSGMIAL